MGPAWETHTGARRKAPAGANSALHSHDFRGSQRPSPTTPPAPSTLGGREPVAWRVPASAHLPMHVPAEASGQALSPQDQVALVTKAIQQDVVLLVFSVSAVVHKGHYVSLKQR